MFLVRLCFSKIKFCPPLIDNVILRVPSHNISKFTQLSVSSKKCPFNISAKTENLVTSKCSWNQFVAEKYNRVLSINKGKKE